MVGHWITSSAGLWSLCEGPVLVYVGARLPRRTGLCLIPKCPPEGGRYMNVPISRSYADSLSQMAAFNHSLHKGRGGLAPMPSLLKHTRSFRGHAASSIKVRANYGKAGSILDAVHDYTANGQRRLDSILAGNYREIRDLADI